MTHHGGQPGYGHGYGGPPRVDARELRPKRVWYLVAGLLAAVLIGLGIASLVSTITGAVDAVDKEGRFRSGESLTLRLEEGDKRTVFVDLPYGSSVGWKCDGQGPTDPSLERPDGSFHVTAGSHTWRRILVLTANATGEQTVTCRADEPAGSAGTAEFAVGEKPGSDGFLSGLLLTFALPALGVIACTLISVVTAVRRSRHRKRLLAERYQPPWGGPSPYGAPYAPPYAPPGAPPPQGGPPPYGAPQDAPARQDRPPQQDGPPRPR